MSQQTSPIQHRATSLPSWYPSFEKYSLKTHFIPLPDDFVHFLLNEDGIHFDGEFIDDQEIEHTSNTQYFFHDLQKDIQKVFQELHTDSVFPKLNWSSPKDACFMAWHNSVRCDSIEEIFRMMKSSDFIMFDLNKCRELDISPMLCIRKHYNVRPSTEFRCFVKNGDLCAISQRDLTNYYKFLHEAADSYRDEIIEFFNQHIKGKFDVEDYVVDLYKSRTDRWWIVDFNLWNLPTHPGLFETWEEVDKACSEDQVSFRYLTTQPAMQPSFQQYSGMPVDLMNVDNFNEFLQELQKQQEEEKANELRQQESETITNQPDETQ